MIFFYIGYNFAELPSSNPRVYDVGLRIGTKALSKAPLIF